jgi:superfamily II RNA helicase
MTPLVKSSGARRLDIVGDFAGAELCGIHGESLVAHCLETAQVDFQVGFQLLHAVHAVEKFLDDLKQRGCNFHLLWFDDTTDCAVPAGSSEHASKYQLTRTILVQHLQRDVHSKQISFTFLSAASSEFCEYAAENALHFVIYKTAREQAQDGEHGSTMYLEGQLMCFGFALGFMETIEFRSSKVYLNVVTSPQSLDTIPIALVQEMRVEPQEWDWRHPMELLQGEPENLELTTRDKVGIISCAAILETNPEYLLHAAAFLMHLDLLKRTSLSERSYPAPAYNQGQDCNEFLDAFAQVASKLIAHWSQEQGTCWTGADLFDIVDGRLFRQVLENFRFIGHLAAGNRLLATVFRLAGPDLAQRMLAFLSFPSPPSPPTSPNKGQLRVTTESSPKVLPFEHQVVDKFLAEVHLETDATNEPDATSQVFRELVHWHNAKSSIDPKRVKKPLGFFARKRNQKLMADTIAYSASLTNSSGKNIEPEIVVVQDRLAVPTRTRPEKPQKKPVKAAKKLSGRQAAQDAAKAVQAKKAEDKSLAVVNYWHQRLEEFQCEDSHVRRYLKVIKYFAGLSKLDKDTVGAEVLLYSTQTLTQLLGANMAVSSTHRRNIIALCWSHLFDLSQWNLNKATSSYAEKLAASLKLTLDVADITTAPRKLPFSTSAKPSIKSLPKNQTEFMLEYCGPYLERSFDSTPDPRVPFAPDAWQRKVLDAIDKDKSVFVIAPTSAGKTFISFYAMKKILQSNDDDVLVYVAPTKALVNQIAAEIQARFSKSYRHSGRSVWAVHTRDYRINNPLGCQVLVTVPHVLQIMLMAPVNAKTPSSWARRVKRIIFDEVHCIGQAEDGVIWEQLLLMAPCPIIALSATVGNPLELRDWLAGTQKRKGFELAMITHSTRYSDLRKFIYTAPSKFKFEGFEKLERLPLPGLDSDGTNPRFSFIHPVLGIMRRDPAIIDDLNLEPRDCLQLWHAMKQVETKEFPVNPELSPERALSLTPKKSDVVEWEAGLKQQLRVWAASADSPFAACQSQLEPDEDDAGQGTSSNSEEQSHLSLILELRSLGALPAIVFNYDRQMCEEIMDGVIEDLQQAERKYRRTDASWKRKLEEYEQWKRAATKKQPKSTLILTANMTKLDIAREEASREQSPFASFRPSAPIAEFSLADMTRITQAELDAQLRPLVGMVQERFIHGLRRGVGVHHAGMNRQYRQVVELLFRRSYLTVVVATGTLALGINMPCKTVVFSGDSPFLTALNYRQASGRAGRRGFDLLGNVVFHNIERHRAMEIMSARLPDLRGMFPMSVTLLLRLFGLLHGTDNSEYAVQMMESLFTQTRLYLGGPASRMSIAHHLRFSIEYLRRQSLLSSEGVPLNFAGLVGHLYFTENAVFAFHALLKAGYLHETCDEIDNEHRRSDILLKLLHILSHLFCRVPCPRYKDKKWLAEVVRPSPSIVILPQLPQEAADILRAHNEETKEIFLSYVHSYVAQHVTEADDELPFTKRTVVSSNSPRGPVEACIRHAPPTIVRSPFAALSGFTDDFSSIHDLVSTVRAGVFLDESAIPFIPIYPEETKGVPFNAYLVDFFKHGDMHALVRDNGIRRGDVWFYLKDFSLVLATIVASLESFLNPDSEQDDSAMADVQDAGDTLNESESSSNESDEEYDSEDSFEGDSARLGKLYKALKLLQTEFDEKFKKVWA